MSESQSAENGLVQEAAVAQDKEAGTASVYTAQAPLATGTPLTAEGALAQLADYLGWQTADKQAALRVEADSTDALPLSGPAGADGSVPTLTFTSLSEDGTAYEFTLTQNEEETLYRVLLDGGTVETP